MMFLFHGALGGIRMERPAMVGVVLVVVVLVVVVVAVVVAVGAGG